MITQEIEKAVQILRNGGLVAFPTETVYGLGADACNEAALQKVFKAKNRPAQHPLIVHIARFEQVTDWALEIPPQAIKLADAFWPGPLTLIFKKKPEVSTIVTGGQASIGLRIPKHEIAQRLLQAFNSGIAAPSANQFTRVSPTHSEAVLEELGDQVDYLLEGGRCELGLESTIIDMSGSKPTLLRPGGIHKQAIEDVLGARLLQPTTMTPRAPGMHLLHYAPRTITHLLSYQALTEQVNKLKAQDLPAILLTRSPLSPNKLSTIKQINMPTQAKAYARELYHTLRSADKEGYKCILIEDVPDGVEWDAIRDRLHKASCRR